MKRNTAWLLIASVIVLTMPAFQNCAGKTSSSETLSSKATSGNGAGYEGKTYVEIDQGGQCPPNVDIKSSLVVRNSDKRAFMTQENCAPVDPPREVTTQMTAGVPHPLYDFQILRGSARSLIFDYLAGPPSTSFEFSLVRCQKVISPTQSLAIAVVKNGMSPNFKGSAFEHFPGAKPEFKAISSNNGNLSMSAGVGGLTYSSTNPLWSVNVNILNGDPADPGHFTGTFTYQEQGQPVTITGLDCYL